jgi:uncharacterized protein (TIGR02145 family)
MKNLFRISGLILFVLSIFLIHSCKKDKPTPPIITTITVSGITQNTATSGGNITSDGGAIITARGVCWSTTSGPTNALSTKTTDNTGTGIFTSSITALTAGTVYYVKAYATNSAGTAYGNEISFTSTASTVPVLTTTAASAITQSTATSGGNITSDGGATVTTRGVCWSTTTGPTTALSTKTTDNTGTGIFTSSITALTAGTVYYVKAYATNSAGTAYGNQISFTSATTIPGAPTIGTTSAGNAQAVVTFTAPVSNGGSAITGYTVTSSPGGITAIGTASPITVTGLTNGTAYTFTVTATNAIGTGVASSASNSVTPSTVPGAPTIGIASAGNAHAVVTFIAPVSNGGSAITGYTTTSVPGGLTSTGTASPITVTGLTNGNAYTFSVTATNAIGTGVASSASNSVTPSTAPGAPTIGIATAGTAQAVVTFTAPVSNGGSAITGYTVTSVPGGLTGTGTASPIIVTGLTNATAYTFTVTATNAIATSAASSASNSVTPLAPITDIDGNVYNTVTIGTQVWMAENLKTTKYNDGTAIPNITVDATWLAATAGAYSDYSNTPANSTIYGRLYNWYAVDNNATTKVASNGGKNVCPTSWHVPTETEWTTLTTYLGGESIAGGKLKETGTTHWLSPNMGATNETGFSALPGGYRYNYGTYIYIGIQGTWWSSTDYSSVAWYRYMSSAVTNVYSFSYFKPYGFSVRCVRDL